MNYFHLFIITWITSQTAKYLIKLLRTKQFTFKELVQTYAYSSGPPSTHAAVLTSSLLLIINKNGIDSPLTYMFSLFALFWLYEIHLQRVRHTIVERLFMPLSQREKGDLLLLKDRSGHKINDLFWGVMTGSIIYLSYIRLAKI